MRNSEAFTLKRCVIGLCILILVNCKQKANAGNERSERGVTTSGADFMSDTSTFPRIYVDQNGNITMNGNSSTIEDVDRQLQEVKARNGIVFYSMDSATANIPKHGIVIELIKKYQVPIKMFADKSFSKPLD